MISMFLTAVFVVLLYSYFTFLNQGTSGILKIFSWTEEKPQEFLKKISEPKRDLRNI